MPMVRAIRMLNAIEAGTTSGAQLETLLGDSGRLAEFNVLLDMRGQARRIASATTTMTAIAASSTAMTAVAASSAAMTAVGANDQALRIFMLAGTDQVFSDFADVAAVIASSTAMTAIAASSTAMTAVVESSTAMTAVIASSTAKMVIFNSDTALAAISASSTALNAMRTAAQYNLYGGTTGTISGPNSSGSYIVVGLSSANGTNGTVTINTKRSGSAVGNVVTADLPRASDGKTYDVAIPVVSPFSVANSGPGYTWFIGMLRCDV